MDFGFNIFHLFSAVFFLSLSLDELKSMYQMIRIQFSIYKQFIWMREKKRFLSHRKRNRKLTFSTNNPQCTQIRIKLVSISFNKKNSSNLKCKRKVWWFMCRVNITGAREWENLWMEGKKQQKMFEVQPNRKWKAIRWIVTLLFSKCFEITIGFDATPKQQQQQQHTLYADAWHICIYLV